MLMEVSVRKDTSFHVNKRSPFPHAAVFEVLYKDCEQALSTNRTHCQGIKGLRKYAIQRCVKVTTQSRATWLANMATSQAEISTDMKFYLPMRSVFADRFRA